MSVSLTQTVRTVQTMNRSLNRAHGAAFPAALYLILSSMDLLFSLVAFSHGVGEANPFMAWLVTVGLFIPGKIAVSCLVAGLMLTVHSHATRWSWVAWGGVAVMGAVTLFHVWGLSTLPVFAVR